ncbi:MAG: hypothetical protein V4772_15680, partial [Pseudomonadota bacterium]
MATNIFIEHARKWRGCFLLVSLWLASPVFAQTVNGGPITGASNSTQQTQQAQPAKAAAPAAAPLAPL